MARGGEKGERTAGGYVTDRVLRGLIGLARALPYRWRVPLMGRIVSHLVAPLAGWRQRVRDNLAHVFPDLPRAEVERLARAVPDNFGRALIETYSGREFIDRIVRIRPQGAGMAALEQAKAEGRPVIFVTGHFGNYEAPRTWMIGHGYNVGALYNPMRNAFFNQHYVAAMSELGTPMFPRSRTGMGEMVRHLKQGGMVGMVIDQFMSHGVLLDFLGKPAPTALSAAELALKYKALLVPIYGIRRPDGLDFDILVEPPLVGDDPVVLTQALNDSLSAVVRAHMDQWFWIHRRWKPERHATLARR